MGSVVDVWDVTTFSPDISRILQANLGLIQGFHTARKKFDEACKRDPTLKYISGPDLFQEYEDFYLQLSERIADAGTLIRSWHYTRLCEHELDRIVRFGTTPPTATTLKGRLAHMVDAHGLTSEMADSLAAQSTFEERYEAGGRDLWAVVKPLPSSDSGVEWLLGFWGGESVYWNAPDGLPRATLRSIGTSTILELAIPASSFTGTVRTAIGKMVLEHFEQSLSLNDYPTLGDVYTSSALGPESILSYIQPTDPRFKTIGRTFPSGLRRSLRRR